MNINIPDFGNWVYIRRLLYSFAITFLICMLGYIFYKDFTIYIFKIEIFNPISPYFQIIGLTCVIYIIIDILDYLRIQIKYCFIKKDKSTWGS